MPYIKQVSDKEATGAVKRELDKAYKRAGRVWNIVRIMTPNAEAMRTSMSFYIALMYGESPLSRAQREMLAVVVSQTNHCRY
ncbi:MAG: carboxymuconolactone decarboxylase family protein [Anaerolineae bacterium]|nr:carboxymuconolactone decarboxylase family protein [Anaerolineae bacterium]